MDTPQLKNAVTAVRAYVDGLFPGWSDARISATDHGRIVVELRRHLQALDGPGFDRVVAAQILEQAGAIIEEGFQADGSCVRCQALVGHDARLFDAAEAALREVRLATVAAVQRRTAERTRDASRL